MKAQILYITHRVPWPPDRGDRIRTWNILKYLSARADVDLICLADEPVSRETRIALQDVTRRLAIVPHGGKLRYLRGAMSMACGGTVTQGLFESSVVRSVVRQWANRADYSATLASSSGIAEYLQSAELSNVRHAWVDLIDVDSQKWLDYARSSRFPMSVVYETEGRRLRELEMRLAQQTERMLVVSDAERELFRDFCPGAPIQAMGNGVDTEYFVPITTQPKPRTCVFVGVLNYLPNTDGVKWFAKEIWPQVRDKFSDAEFRVVGKNPPSDIEALDKLPGVSVVGPVPDVRPWLNESSCVVVPLRIARGVQNKVLEAMACGRPIICSSEPLKGLAVESGLQLIAADEPTEWVDGISKVFTDSCHAEELGMAASAWVQLNHRWNSCLQPLDEIVDTTTSEPEREIEVGK